MDDSRLCSDCGANLAGPFQPKIALTLAPSSGEAEKKIAVTARAWICPDCGLVHWYAQDEDLSQLPLAGTDEEQAAAPKPGTSYERRVQMRRMLRRVRRM